MSLANSIKKSWLGLAVGMVWAASGCGSHAVPAAAQVPTAAKAPVVETVPQNRDADDTARFLAGMPGKPGSPYAELESSPVWQEHRQGMDKAWSGTGSSLIPGPGEVQKQELGAAPLDTAPGFYPL